jgi:hypothetical protein
MSFLSLPIIGGSISGDLANDLVKAFLDLEADVVKQLVEGVMSAIAATTSVTPEEGNGWFASVADNLAPVEMMVVAPLIFAATIGAIFRQDLGRLARIWGAGLPISLIGGFAVVKLAYIGMTVTDGLSSLVQAEVAPNMGTDLVNAVTFGINNSLAGPLGGLISLVVLAGGLTIWLELALRAAAIELAVFFMPLAFAGLVWPVTAHWAKRLLQLLSALLLAKPVIVGALCLGDNALTSSRTGPSAMVTGAAILLMAAFAPMVLLKLIPLVEVSAIAHLQGLSRQPVQAAERSFHRVMAMAGSARAAASVAPTGSASQLLNQIGGPGDDGHPLGPARPPGPGPASPIPAARPPSGPASSTQAPSTPVPSAPAPANAVPAGPAGSGRVSVNA